MIALSPNFLVKVPKLEESEMREKSNGIYLHPNFVWMTRNTQCGEIVSISPEAQRQLPQARIGDILLFHHFIQRSNSVNVDDNKFLAFEDDDYKYYNVNAKQWNGNNNNTYGVWNGGEIIPHSDYVFLEKQAEVDGYAQSNEKVYEKMEVIKKDIEYLAKNKMTDDLLALMKSKEKEMQQSTLQLQKKEYIKYFIAYPLNQRNTEVYALNIACKTELLFMGNTYIIAESKYIGATIPSFQD